jgi:hypothetical protein
VLIGWPYNARPLFKTQSEEVTARGDQPRKTLKVHCTDTSLEGWGCRDLRREKRTRLSGSWRVLNKNTPKPCEPSALTDSRLFGDEFVANDAISRQTSLRRRPKPATIVMYTLQGVYCCTGGRTLEESNQATICLRFYHCIASRRFSFVASRSLRLFSLDLSRSSARLNRLSFSKSEPTTLMPRIFCRSLASVKIGTIEHMYNGCQHAKETCTLKISTRMSRSYPERSTL